MKPFQIVKISGIRDKVMKLAFSLAFNFDYSSRILLSEI